jgi:hypothetical protein
MGHLGAIDRDNRGRRLAEHASIITEANRRGRIGWVETDQDDFPNDKAACHSRFVIPPPLDCVWRSILNSASDSYQAISLFHRQRPQQRPKAIGGLDRRHGATDSVDAR